MTALVLVFCSCLELLTVKNKKLSTKYFETMFLKLDIFSAGIGAPTVNYVCIAQIFCTNWQK